MQWEIFAVRYLIVFIKNYKIHQKCITMLYGMITDKYSIIYHGSILYNLM